MPPISRIEEKGQARRCQRLRKNLRAAYADIVPILAEQCRNLKQLIQEDDLEKYLDVYEISNPDMQEAALGYSESEFDDAETLKVLRILQQGRHARVEGRNRAGGRSEVEEEGAA